MKELIKSLLFDIEERLNVVEANIITDSTKLELSKNTYNELKYFQHKVETILRNSDKQKENGMDKLKKYTFDKSLEEMFEDLGDRILEIIDKDSFDLETKNGIVRIFRGESFFYNIDTKEFLEESE
jgi:C-terminal processing protease CtpA/Prc